MSFVSNFTDPNTMNNDKIIDRDALQDSMIQQILDDMDIKKGWSSCMLGCQ